MNKSSKNVVIGVVVIVVIGLVVWLMGRGGSTNDQPNIPQSPLEEASGSAPVSVSETTKVSGSLSKYENVELGFGVQYPSAWQRGELPNGVQLVMPIDPKQVTTVNKLEADITVSPGKCAFPPVTTVESRGTMTVQGMKANMITLSNSVQGRSYWNRMVSLEKDGICYFFSFAYIALSTDKLTGSNLTQAENNNNALKLTADASFTDMVKSLVFVAPPEGKDESAAAPKK